MQRTVFIPTSGVSVVEFDLDRAAQERLYQAGREAAAQFLRTWDFGRYVALCRRAG